MESAGRNRSLSSRDVPDLFVKFMQLFPGLHTFPEFLSVTGWSDRQRTYEMGISFDKRAGVAAAEQAS
jgi:hypothetical protein